MKSKDVLGVDFLEHTFEGVLNRIKTAWSKSERLRIATLNPEFLVAAEKSAPFKRNLNLADIKTVDGFGLYLALRLRGWQGERITGVELVEKVLREAEVGKQTVAVVLKHGGLSSLEAVKEAIVKKYPQLSCSVLYYSPDSLPQAGLVLLALGAPEQEYVAEQIQQGVVIGVGGAIDFLTGAQKRAPKILQHFGLEWLWRLLLQPKRFKRIWNAVIIFPILAVFK